jgi:nitrate reductase NapAB chaperone NapD
MTIQEIVAAVLAAKTPQQLQAVVAGLSALQKCQLDLYAAQGGFRGTGQPSI